MAHEIAETSTGKAGMAYTGEAPWHGLGQQLPQDADIDTWREAAGLDWEAVKVPVMYKPSPATTLTMDKRCVLIRSDTGAALSVVSNNYHPVQPNEILEFFRDLVDAIGGFKMETAGMLRGGRKVWALAKAPVGGVELLGKDQINRYLLLATSYDKSLPTLVQQTSVRVVCANTLGMAFQAGEEGTETRAIIKHFTKFDATRIKTQLALDEAWHTFGITIEKLSRRRVTPVTIKKFFTDCLYTVEEQKAKEFNKELAATRVGELQDVYAKAPGQDLESAKGTMWGALNAVTYFADHLAKSHTPEMRLDNAWFGRGQDLKNRAAALALTV